MARLTRPGADRIYWADRRWVDCALRSDGSLFTPDRPIWTAANAQDLGARLSQTDEALEGFEDRLHAQFEGAAADIYQLAAEALFVYFLVDRATTAKRKRSRINQILGWSPKPVEIPPDLDAVLDEGLVHPGAMFGIARPYLLRFLLEAVARWKVLPTHQREVALEDPWAFREFLFGWKIKRAQNMREALLHLVHPDAFEAIVSGKGGDKAKLVNAFKQYVTDQNANIDQQILQIRNRLEPEEGVGFNFYKEKLRAIWKPETDGKPERVHPPTAKPVAVTAGPVIDVVDPLLAEMAEALQRRGQLILYGPPGTGKTYMARRFSVWWLAQKLGRPKPGEGLHDEHALKKVERELSTSHAERRAWWVVANPKEWSWDRLASQNTVDYRYGRLERNYPLVQPGDLVIGYEATPTKRIVALARIRTGMHPVGEEQKITLEHIAVVNDGLTFEELGRDTTLRASEPMRFRCQGTLFALTEEEADYLLALLAERDSSLPDVGEGAEEIGALTRVTFHPTYGYEDFVEGYRPVDSGTGQIALRLTDGIFKQVCRAAQAHPERTYLVLVDEINRGNLPKIFGELITLLEQDKRGLSLVLPQSRENFVVPPRVYVLGTMNTADRSIRLLDAALRRRFAFIELMPRPELLAGSKVAGLDLARFLRDLNLRIATTAGREKQIGHSYFLGSDAPVSTVDEFHARFTQEVLPLLQEYAYDDYTQLETLLGSELVDVEARQLSVSNADALVASLKREYQPNAEPAAEETAEAAADSG